ncbi:MAG TPA: IS1634 family transposase [Porphyromonadaceae bacterium]|nr:IS1634 family transposase [Porphyromonadaceae bacterium]
MNKVKRRGNILTWVGVVESYRPGGGAQPKQRTIKSFGYLEDQADPITFMKTVEEFNASYRTEAPELKVEFEVSSKMYSAENRRQNYGWKYLSSVYDMLSIDSFIGKYIKDNNIQVGYKPSEIFKYLVLSRILNPDSKRASCQMKNGLYEMTTDFTLQDVYRSLDVLSRFEIELQRHLNNRVKAKIGRDLTNAFYDVTNYYFEIDFPDGAEDLRKRGVSKEHRVDPISAMGLFMDSNGIPVSMSIFPGNTSESLTLQPTMRDVKASYGLGRLVVVADKGLNTSKNIDAIINNGDGFIFSQVLRGTKGQRYHEKLFNGSGWVVNKEGSYRYKLFEEEYTGINMEGKKEIRTRKTLLYWDKSDADMAKRKREEKLEKAARSVKNNAYSIKKGVDEYTKDNVVDKGTGEILENIITKRSVNIEKAERDSLFDGYFCIITSELDYGERKIRQAYGGLWRIEQSFRIMKSDLYARPVFVRKNEHIRAHFLICFVALLIIRIIQHQMGNKALSVERIARTLNAATLRVLKGGVVQLDDVGGVIAFKKRINKSGELVDTLEYSNDDEIALDFKLIQEAFGTAIDKVYYRQEVFNRCIKAVTLDKTHRRITAAER